ncbi:hypothetical protein [Methylobacterium sp. 1030]|uniref:hypothetical protein n=1 Tax=Methylobacterium sp. 1030 TaxID=3156404 RepID=UPI003399D7AA
MRTAFKIAAIGLPFFIGGIYAERKQPEDYCFLPKKVPTERITPVKPKPPSVREYFALVMP